MKKNLKLIWDFDDTIVQTNIEFEKTNQETAEIIALDIFGDLKPVQELKDYQRKLDVEMISEYGFVPPRYLLSWIATYEYFAKVKNQLPSEKVRTLIRETVEDLYVRKYQNIKESIPVLKELKNQGYSMVILTAGQEDIQKRKVSESGAFSFFDEVYVYPKKTPDTLKEIMNHHEAECYVMIGNSLKSDIYPALENDAYGFHFERETWEADYHDIDKKHPKYVHITCLTEIPKKLKGINLNHSILSA